MVRWSLVLKSAVIVAVMGGCAGQSAPVAHTASAKIDQSKYAAYLPDPTHIPFMTLDKVPWTGEVGREQQYNIYGDPRKPGSYAMLLKWYPGAFSRPHYHPKARYVTVLQGTWWVSSSNVYDPSKTYPLPVGTVVTDEINTVHWDGAKDEPTILLITGEGPSPNINVDENGKPKGANNF